MFKGRKSGLGCLTLFGGVFLVAGVGIFLWQIKAVFKSWQASDWLPVQATLTHVEQTVSHGDNSTTYAVKGSYQYQVAGKTYQSNQLNFHNVSDNIGSYQQDFYRQLSFKRNNSQTITAYYDPDNPSEAVIDRSVRWGLIGFGSIFLLVFGGAGAGIIFAGFWGARKLKEEDGFKTQFSDEPWKWKKEWQQTYFSPRTKASYVAVGIFALFWNLISIPIAAFALPQVIEKGQYIGLLVLLFPLVGIGMISWTLLLYLRHKKFGQTKLYLEDDRIKIGAINKGSVELTPQQLTNSDAIIRLASIHRYESGSGDDKSTKEKILWEDTYRVSLNASTINFSFKVPKELQETDESNSRSGYLWRLNIDSKQSGPDLKLDFDIPGFRLTQAELLQQEELAADLFNDSYNKTPYYKQTDSGDWTKLGLIQKYSNAGSEYFFPRMNGFTWWSGGIAGLIFVIIGFVAYFYGAPIIFPIVFGLLGGLIGILCFRAALFKSRIFIDSGNLYYQTGHLWFGKTVVIPRDSIRNFDTVSHASSDTTKFYNLLVKTQQGQTHTIAKNLTVKGDINAFIDKLKADLGISI